MIQFPGSRSVRSDFQRSSDGGLQTHGARFRSAPHIGQSPRQSSRQSGLQGKLELHLLLDERVEGDDEVVVVQDVEVRRRELEAVVRVSLSFRAPLGPVRLRGGLALPPLLVRRREDPERLARAAERDLARGSARTP